MKTDTPRNRATLSFAHGWRPAKGMVDVGFIIEDIVERDGFTDPNGKWHEKPYCHFPHYWEDRNAIIDALSRQPIEFQQKVMHRLMQKRFAASYATFHCQVQMSFKHMAQLMTCDVALIADSFLECL